MKTKNRFGRIAAGILDTYLEENNGFYRIRDLVFVSPLFPWASCVRCIWLHSFRTELK